MKTMTCKELGGTCDLEFTANTFEEVAGLSQQHGMDMFQKKDSEHLAAMEKVQELMKDPAAMQKWINEKKEVFDSKPTN